MTNVFAVVVIVAATALVPLRAAAGTIDFESLADLEIVATQFPGLTFANATALTAGISLNEFEFPPQSGNTVVTDEGGPLSIVFATPVTSVGGYFTYLTPLVLEAFDSSNVSLGTITSTFLNNLALTGDAGSSANEFLSFASALGIGSIVVTGDPAGGSFVMDDLTMQPVAEPGTGLLILAASAVLGAAQRWANRRHGVASRRS